MAQLSHCNFILLVPQLFGCDPIHPTCLKNSEHYFMMSLSMSHGIAYDTTFCIRLDTHIPHTHSRHRPQCCARESSLARGFTSIRECAWCWKLHKYRTGLSHKFEDFLGDIKHQYVKYSNDCHTCCDTFEQGYECMNQSRFLIGRELVDSLCIHSPSISPWMHLPTHESILPLFHSNPSSPSFALLSLRVYRWLCFVLARSRPRMSRCARMDVLFIEHERTIVFVYHSQLYMHICPNTLHRVVCMCI